MKKLPIIVCAFVLALASCKKKEYPETITGSPEFYVKASVDGQDLLLQAGTFDYYMYSNYEQDSAGVYSFVADVKQKNCTGNCPNSLKFEFYDNQISSQGGASNINASVKTGTYNFVNTNTVNPSIIGYAATFKSSYNLTTASSYSWNYFSGAPSYSYGAPSPTAVVTHTYAYPGIYQTHFAVKVGSDWTSIVNPVKITVQPNVTTAQILVQSVNGNAVQFNKLTSGIGPFDYQWNFGDGFSSPDDTPLHTYQSSGIYHVSLRVVDVGNNDTAYHNYNVNTAQSQLSAPNFHLVRVLPILSNSPLSKVRISYTDHNGTVYNSAMEPQTNNIANFQIVSVDEYRSNEKNQPTKRLKIKFNCKLFNGASTVTITNGEAVIAVAYK